MRIFYRSSVFIINLKYLIRCDPGFQILSRQRFLLPYNEIHRCTYTIPDLSDNVGQRERKIYFRLGCRLTCRLLICLRLKSSIFCSFIFFFVDILVRNKFQIFFFIYLFNSPNFIAKWILLWNTSSNVITRLVVRIIML